MKIKQQMSEAKSSVARAASGFWELYFSLSMIGMFIVAALVIRQGGCQVSSTQSMVLIVLAAPIAVEGAIKFYRFLSK